MVQNKKSTLPDTPKAAGATTKAHCISGSVCGMEGTETVYGPAVVGGTNVVFDKNHKAASTNHVIA